VYRGYEPGYAGDQDMPLARARLEARAMVRRRVEVIANHNHKKNRAGAYTIPSWAIVQALGAPAPAPRRRRWSVALLLLALGLSV